MKTPFDDLEFKLEYNKINDHIGTSVHVVCKLIHIDLPIAFSMKFECTDKFEKSKPDYVQEQISKLINQLYKQVYVSSIMSKSIVPYIFGTGQKLYTGEWDQEKEAWFVLNSVGDKCYTSTEIKSLVSDEFNTY